MIPPLIGYCYPLRGRAGDQMDFFISSEGGQSFEARIIRIICGDPNPAGPGFKFETMQSDVTGVYPGKAQSVPMGSCGRAPIHALASLDKAAMVVNVQPTASDDRNRVVMALQDAGGSAFLAIAVRNSKIAILYEQGGKRYEKSSDLSLSTGHWHSVGLGFEGGKSTLVLELMQLNGDRQDCLRQCIDLPVAVDISGFTHASFAGVWRGRPELVFNGLIEQPSLRRDAAPQIAESGGSLGIERAELRAQWDFSANIDQQTIIDTISGRAGELVNVPMRGMRGSNWNGSEFNWRHAPEQYGAIHFHDDDLTDCGWETSVSFRIPEQLSSGIYALEVLSDLGHDTIPFFVLPKRGSPKKSIAVLASTFTYLAYGNHARGNFDDDFRKRVTSWGAYQWNPDEVPEFGKSTYNYHSDGSGIAMSSFRRPLLTMRPGFLTFNDARGSGLRHFPADTHLTGWLEAMGFEYDIITDEDLDEEGVEALAGYDVLVTGSHPEYHTPRSLDALQFFRKNGGNLVYLGGNGFYWRIARRADLPHVMEIRRAEGGIRAWAAQVGEYYQQLDGGYGGLWRRNGRPPQQLAGVGFAIQGMYEASYYRRTAESYDPDVAWVFQDVNAETFGNYGLFGGGAAGFELDQVASGLGTPEGTVIVACSEGHGPSFQLAPEEILTYTLAASGCPKVEAHMVLGTPPGQGMFFATSSISFIGSLCHNQYGNDCSFILRNVLERFAKVKAPPSVVP